MSAPEPSGAPPAPSADDEPGGWTPSANQITLFLALAVALLVHVGIGYRPFPSADQLAYVPASWRAIGLVDYARDPALRDTLPYFPVWIGLTWLFEHSVGLATGFWLTTLALGVATVLGVRALLSSLSASGWNLALVALIVFAGRIGGLGRGEFGGMFGHGFHAQWVALCLLLWCYVSLLRQQPWRAGVLLGLTAIAHPVVALHGALGVALGCLTAPALGWRGVGKAALPAALIASPMIVAVARALGGPASAWGTERLIQDGWLFRVPQEFLFYRVGAATWASLALILALGLTGLRLLWREQSTPARVLGGLVLAHLTLLAGALILPLTSTWILLLHLTRTTPMLLLLCVVCTVAGLQAAPRREHELADLLLIRVIQAGVLFLLLAFVAWNATLLPLAAVCLAAWLTARADQPRAAAAILILGAWLGLLLSVLVDQRQVELPPPEANLYAWVREQPAGALFVVPPSAERFRYFGRHSVYVDFKFFPASARQIPGWRERLEQVARPDAKALLLRGWPAVPEWDRCYRAANTPQRIAQLLKATGADFVVLERPVAKGDADPRVAVAFQDERYVVYGPSDSAPTR